MRTKFKQKPYLYRGSDSTLTPSTIRVIYSADIPQDIPVAIFCYLILLLEMLPLFNALITDVFCFQTKEVGSI